MNGNGRNIVNLVLLGAGLYVAYQIWQAFKPGGPGPAPAVSNAVGNWLNEIFTPQPTTSNLFYSVAFPDGSVNAIDASSIGSTGLVSYNGSTYQIFIDSSVAAGINKRAVLVSTP